MPSQKITIEVIDLKYQRIVGGHPHELELEEKAFTLRMKFKAEEPQGEDEALPWKEVDNDVVLKFRREMFAGLEKMWIGADKRWRIVVYTSGVNYDMRLFFKRQKDCEAVFDQLEEYFFKGNS